MFVKTDFYFSCAFVDGFGVWGRSLHYDARSFMMSKKGNKVDGASRSCSCISFKFAYELPKSSRGICKTCIYSGRLKIVGTLRGYIVLVIRGTGLVVILGAIQEDIKQIPVYQNTPLYFDIVIFETQQTPGDFSTIPYPLCCFHHLIFVANLQ